MNVRSRQVGETDSQTSINCVNIYVLFYLVVGGLKISYGFSTIQILGFTFEFLMHSGIASAKLIEVSSIIPFLTINYDDCSRLRLMENK